MDLSRREFVIGAAAFALGWRADTAAGEPGLLRIRVATP